MVDTTSKRGNGVEQGERPRRTTLVEWVDTEAESLLERIVGASADVGHAIAQGKWLSAATWWDAEGNPSPAVKVLEETVGGLAGALEMFCERWGLPQDAMQREARRAENSLISKFEARTKSSPCVRESAEVLRALTTAMYAVGASLAVGGTLDRVEAAPLDDEEIPPEEWLAMVFGYLQGALWAARMWWGLSASAVGQARGAARREYRHAWPQVPPAIAG